jgi:hypothetical protein
MTGYSGVASPLNYTILIMRLRATMLRFLKEVFDDWITRAAGIVFILIFALVMFNVFSAFPQQHPLIGVFLFGMVPALFILGGIIFVLAILKS